MLRTKGLILLIKPLDEADVHKDTTTLNFFLASDPGGKPHSDPSSETDRSPGTEGAELCKLHRLKSRNQPLGYKSFEDLDVWKQSCRLAVRIYDELEACRDFGLKDPMTRCAVSIPSNIAEGAERDSKQEYMRFLHIAKGSAAEFRTQIYIAGQIGLLQKSTVTELVSELKHISATLQSIVNTLKKRLTT